MPEMILGIDIKSDSLTAVQVQGGLRGYTIKGCSRVMIEQQGGLDEALRELNEQMDLKADTCMSSIPGEQASYRNLQIPFKSEKKIRQTIGFTVEEMVPYPIEEAILDYTIVDQSDQSEILVAAVSRKYISEYLALLQSYEVDPDVMDIGCVPLALWLLGQGGVPDNGLILDMGLKNATMVLYLKRRISLIRTFPFNDAHILKAGSDPSIKGSAEAPEDEEIESSFKVLCTAVHNTLHAFEYQSHLAVAPEVIFITGSGGLRPDTESLLERFLDIPVERINVAHDQRVHMEDDIEPLWDPDIMNSALALALRDFRQEFGFNFRKDDFEVTKRRVRLRKEIRKVAVFLLVILFLACAYGGMDYYFLKQRSIMLDRKITEIFRQTLPEVKRIVDPIQQIKVKIKEVEKSALTLPGIGGNQNVLNLIRDISLRVPYSLDVRVITMIIDPEAVQIKGETDSFNTVDSIKKGLEPSEYFSEVTISSANLDRSGKRVQFDLKLKRAQ